MSKLRHVASTVSLRAVIVTGLAFGGSFSYAANDSVPYRVSMTRTEPNTPLRKSTIMAQVKVIYPGRILSIMEDRARGADCHIVKLMGNDGEFRIIHVACQ